jgi:hypothetical protein
MEREWCWLGGIVLVSVLLRLMNAWIHPGFSTGDDVEIHEMTLRRLFDADWRIWELRSALYPMTVVYPVQSLAYRFVGDDVEALVVAGRLAVVVVATLSVWLVYRIVLTLTGNGPTALLAAALMATSRLHLWYASSELPRPVATVLLLAGVGAETARSFRFAVAPAAGYARSSHAVPETAEAECRAFVSGAARFERRQASGDPNQ